MSANKKEGSAPEPIKSPKLCWTCDANISKIPYIRCAKCFKYQQCLECFSTAASCDDHLLDHQIMVFDYVEEPLTREGWSTEEEALLLFGVKTCGIGNWEDIKEVVETKSALECEEHYFQTYIDSDNAPFMPDEILPPLELPPPLPYDTTPRDSRPAMNNEHYLSSIGKTVPTTPAEFAGYMPKRDEFEIEYINEAEEIIAKMSFGDGSDFNYKVSQLVAYNKNLQERKVRKDIALQYGLIDKNVSDFGGKSKEEKEIEHELMPLAQGLEKTEILNLVRAIEDEIELKNKIKELKKWLENGIYTYEEGKMFNNFVELMNKHDLTQEDVDEWNRKVMQMSSSVDYKDSLYQEMLTKEENSLCNNLNILPNDYLEIKDLLIREYMINGSISELQIQNIIPGLETITKAIFKFLSNNNIFPSTN